MTSKRKTLIALIAGWLTLGIGSPSESLAADTSASASAQSTGTISGRVQNVATGQYLNQARVTLKGTNQVVYTDRFGVFQLVNVPAGPATLEIFYTGLDLAEIPLAVPAGGTVEQAVGLSSRDRYGDAGTALQLDAFVVSSDRETDAQAIATNEQRFAPNLKSVMATDSLGDVLGSSVGEFMKFIPGITVEYDSNDISGISVRGIGGSMTTITSDGAPSSNIWVSGTRSVDVRSMGLNDIARIELTKVPTPATPADSLAGSVNMVSKSAFERSGRQLRYGLNLTGHDENLTFKKTPHAYHDRKTYKVLPGVNFDFTLPLSQDFGIVIAGMHTKVYNEERRVLYTWANAGTGTNASAASPSNPFLAAYDNRDGNRNLVRNTLSFKLDWRIMRHGVLSLGQTFNRATTEYSSPSINFNLGTNGTPTPATGVPLTWDAGSYFGATGRGTITNSDNEAQLKQATDNTNLRFRFDNGIWGAEAGVTRSASSTSVDSVGNFIVASAVNNRPIRINFIDVDKGTPDKIEVYDNTGQPFEWHDISNFRGNTALVQEDYSVRNFIGTGYVNISRQLEFFSIPSRIQIGAHRRYQEMDLRPTSLTTTFRGPDGNSQATAPLDPYTFKLFRSKFSNNFDLANLQRFSARHAKVAYDYNPLLYSPTPAQEYNEANTRIQGSEHIEEYTNAFYLQTDAYLLDNRLRLLAGVRFEKTTGKGQGALIDPNAVWMRDANGDYVRDAAGNRIRRPEAGASNSLEQIALTHTERGAKSERSYDGYYPSFHATYSLTDNLLFRAAYAKTYGRPDFVDIIPRTTTNEADLPEEELEDPNVVRGTLTVRNSALKPWSADNFDVSMEYYTPQGGLLSLGLFLKELQDFFGNEARIATLADLQEMGLDSRYVGWNVVTKFNSGDAQIKGAEINLRHSLRFLGTWGSYFTVFANGTRLNLSGHQRASFTSFIPKSGNAGVSFNRKRLGVTARWNYRGQDRRSPQAAFGPDGYQYIESRLTLDISAVYQITQRLSLNLSLSNVLDSPLVQTRYGSQTPDYARRYYVQRFGTPVAIGIKGVF